MNFFMFSPVEDESWWLCASDLRDDQLDESEDSSEEDDDEEDEEEEGESDGEFDVDSDDEDAIDSTLGFNPKACLLKVDAG